MPSLVSVIGPVEPDLLRAFIDHYRGHGIREFFLGFHFTDQASSEVRDRLLRTCEELVGPPVIISQGPWHETVHSELRDHLRVRAGVGWHVIADIDEFHDYPAPLDEIIDGAEEQNSAIVGGILFDRVARDGSLGPWSLGAGLDKAFPLGGFLTARLLGGNPGKVVAAHSSARLSLGSHRCLDEAPTNRPIVPVHHFKWRAGILEDLRRRVVNHTSGAWRENGPWIRNEATKLLDHIEGNFGRIDVTDPILAFRPACLGDLPEGWDNDTLIPIERALGVAPLKGVTRASGE
ncbi:hypothetical protein [Streptomyces sp. NPDC088350]|uniref:hypothetical protein n=1 Tax=Streptomyces sp. NPDC088350 TaxID=3365854 RepID=UPI00382A6B18